MSSILPPVRRKEGRARVAALALRLAALFLVAGAGLRAQTPWVDWGQIQFVRVSRDAAEYDRALKKGAETGRPLFLFFT